MGSNGSSSSVGEAEKEEVMRVIRSCLYTEDFTIQGIEQGLRNMNVTMSVTVIKQVVEVLRNEGHIDSIDEDHFKLTYKGSN